MSQKQKNLAGSCFKLVTSRIVVVSLNNVSCQKILFLLFLLSPPPEEGFDPATYIIGPEEDLPRKLDYLTFVMHAPDDYFYYKHAPYPTRSYKPDQEYILTRAGPKVRLIKDGKALYRDPN